MKVEKEDLLHFFAHPSSQYKTYKTPFRQFLSASLVQRKHCIANTNFQAKLLVCYGHRISIPVL